MNRLFEAIDNLDSFILNEDESTTIIQSKELGKFIGQIIKSVGLPGGMNKIMVNAADIEYDKVNSKVLSCRISDAFGVSASIWGITNIDPDGKAIKFQFIYAGNSERRSKYHENLPGIEEQIQKELDVHKDEILSLLQSEVEKADKDHYIDPHNYSSIKA